MAMTPIANLFLGTFGVVLLVILVLIIRNRILFSIAIRNMVRHRAQTLVVIGGLLIGSMVISASMTVGDSLQYSRTVSIYDELGSLDISIRALNWDNGAYLNMSVYDAYATNESFTKYTDAITPTILEVPLATVDLNSNKMKLGQTFSGFGGETCYITGVDTQTFTQMGKFRSNGKSYDGSDISGINVVINEKYAKALDASEGDSILILYNSYTEGKGSSVPSGIYPYQNLTNQTGGVGQNATANGTSGMSQGFNASALMDMAGSMIMNKTLAFSVVKVAKIVDDTGPGGLFGDMHIFVALDTAQSMFNKTGQFNYLMVSLKGGVRSGLKYNNNAERVGNKILNDLNLSKYARVYTIKQDRVDSAEKGGASFSGYLIMMSGFTIAASALLIVNLFIMLSEERKSELGIERAIGMKRRYLIYQFLFEGFVYSLISAFIGTILGLGVARIMLNVFNMIFSSEHNSDLVLHIVPSSLAVSFIGGFLLSIVVIIWTTWKISKLNIVLAIRDLEETEEERNKSSIKLGLFLLIVGILTSIPIFASSGLTYATVFLVGPVLLISGTFLLLRKFIGPRISFTSIGLGITLFIVYYLLYGPSIDDNSGFLLFVIEGIMLVLAVVLIIMYNSDFTARLIEGLARSSRMKAKIKPALGYPLHKKFKSGMTVSMFSLVIFILVLFSTFSNLFTIDAASESGGYELWGGIDSKISSFDDIDRASGGLMDIASSAGNVQGINITRILMNQTTDENIYDYIDYADFVWTGTVLVDDFRINNYSYKHGIETMRGTKTDFFAVPTNGIDSSFAKHNTWKFKEIMKGFDEQSVWNAVIQPNSTYVIVGGDYQQTYSGDPNHAGDTLQYSFLDGRTLNFTIAGILDTMVQTGVFTSKPMVELITAPMPLSTSIYVHVKNRISPEKANDILMDKYSVFGFQSVVFEKIFNEIFDAMMNILNMFQIFLGLGLIVGFASLGVVSMRSTIERRREIGMMRAVGFCKMDITAAFLFESIFVTTLGVIIGTLTGLFAAYGIWHQSMQDLVDFSIPWKQILILFAIVYASAIAATIYPSVKASRVPVAEALRYYE